MSIFPSRPESQSCSAHPERENPPFSIAYQGSSLPAKDESPLREQFFSKVNRTQTFLRKTGISAISSNLRHSFRVSLHSKTLNMVLPNCPLRSARMQH